MSSNLLHADGPKYLNFLKDVKDQVNTTRIQAARAMNKHLIQFYWWLGEEIVKRQERHSWGKTVVEQLAKDLKAAFPNTKGFSASNLWRTRSFYLEYKDHSILAPLVREIGWSHNILIFEKIKGDVEREFYIRSTAEYGWSRNVLAFQIGADLYHRQTQLPKQNNFSDTLPKALATQADESMKSIYMLELLGLKQPVEEAVIENKMVEVIQRVMLELGQGFSFIGNQYPIRTPEGDYFIDLLFFSRPLQSLVAIELKAGSYKPEYAGKMGFYLNLLDDFVRLPHENPAIGLVLCQNHKTFEVEYSMRSINKPMGVANFVLNKALPDDLADKLPDAKHIERELQRQLKIDNGDAHD